MLDVKTLEADRDDQAAARRAHEPVLVPRRHEDRLQRRARRHHRPVHRRCGRQEPHAAHARQERATRSRPWSPDGQTIAFATERGPGTESRGPRLPEAAHRALPRRDARRSRCCPTRSGRTSIRTGRPTARRSPTSPIAAGSRTSTSTISRRASSSRSRTSSAASPAITDVVAGAQLGAHGGPPRLHLLRGRTTTRSGSSTIRAISQRTPVPEVGRRRHRKPDTSRARRDRRRRRHLLQRPRRLPPRRRAPRRGRAGRRACRSASPRSSTPAP